MAGDEMLSDAIVERAISGFPVIYPTSNLPALGCVPTTDALDLLYKLKQRKAEMKVSLAVSDLEQAAEIVEVNQNVVRLLSDFPTGSLTLVLPALKQMDERVGGDKIAIRVIDTPITQLLLKRVGPLTATSANLSGIEPETDCDSAALALDLDSNAVISSNCTGGPPSTLIQCHDYAGLMSGEQLLVLREGIVSKSEVKAWSMKMN